MTLTINIDEKKLQKVRSIVEREGKSVEKALEDYLDNLLQESLKSSTEGKKENEEDYLSLKLSNEMILQELTPNPTIAKLQRIRELQNKAGITPRDDFNDKEDYREYIIRKNA